MATMLPAALSPKVKSNAEKIIFKNLAKDPRTKNWYILHSLGIESQFNKVYGEIDFLLLAPELGIFALEVKGGGVKRQQGLWVYTDRYDTNFFSNRSPVDQAKEGMFNVMSYLKRHSKIGSIHKMLFGFGLMFPDINFQNDDPDLDQIQVFDLKHKQDIYHYIVSLSNFYQDRKTKSSLPFVLPTKDDIKQISKILRPDFDISISLEAKKNFSEEEIVTITEEQYRCIDGLRDNPRCIITGFSGSGKSILALKHYKEKLSEDGGTLFLTDNLAKVQLIKTNLLNDGFSHINDLHSFESLLEILLQSIKAKGFYFDQDKNISIEEKILFILDHLPLVSLKKYQSVIIDQAQEFMNEYVFMLVNELIEGGLKLGNWFVFGDFEVHRAFKKEITIKNINVMLNVYDTKYALFQLTENCRNSPTIVHEANLYAGIKDPFINPLKIYHHQVEYLQFRDDADLVSKIQWKLKGILSQKMIHLEDITIIDMANQSNLIKEELIKLDPSHFKGINIHNYEDFKGRESSISIIINVNNYDDRYSIYHAILTGRTAVFIYETHSAMNFRIKFIRKK
jgi:hypothetical protein